MLLGLQIMTIFGMLIFSFIAFSAFGAPKASLLFTSEEKQEFDKTIGASFGSWLTVTNIIGTLSSLATVYIFFIGSSKLFGFWIFLCPLTIFFGAYITNYFTHKLTATERIRTMLDSPDQTGGVIASLFWKEGSPKSISTSMIVKWTSLITIACVIWLEFALFTHISALLTGMTGYLYKGAMLFCVSFSILYFTFRFGLRGFVFADFFQAPLLVLATLILLWGSSYLISNAGSFLKILPDLYVPILSTTDCIFFAIQVLSLNLLLVLVTEPHWIRVWIFKKKETTLQAKSAFATGILWALMSILGLFTFAITAGKIGELAIVGLLAQMGTVSPVFIVAFWIGGIAALFSTADSQIYSYLLVKNFDTASGRLSNEKMTNINPFYTSLLMSILFVMIYLLTRSQNLPFDKLMFVMLPLCLNIFPAFVIAALNGEQNPIYLIISLTLYITCSVLGFLQTDNSFFWTLLAPFCPIIVSSFIFAKYQMTRKVELA